MLHLDVDVYLQAEEGGPLYAAAIAEGGDERVAVRLIDARLEPRPGLPLWLLFHDEDGRLLKRPGVVGEVISAGSEGVAELLLEGAPVGADLRSTARVSTVVVGLGVTVNDEVDCPMLDASAVGFAVLSSQKLEVGQIVAARFTYQRRTYRGNAAVCSARALSAQDFRYGLQCVPELSGTLVTGLRAVYTGVTSLVAA